MKDRFEFGQIGYTAANIFVDVERVDDPKVLSGRWHQLHQPHCAFG